MVKRPFASSLNNFSKDELIRLVLKHEPHRAYDSIAKPRKRDRKFEASEYSSKYVALKVAYFGGKYQGFASQVGLKNICHDSCQVNAANTVEDHIFRAMLRTKLILDPETCQYSRCGRTDAGVSATGQVIALKLRSSSSKDRKDQNEVLDYARILNRQLPDDIRILDWADVDEKFSARFSCSARLYHYYFCKQHYDPMTRSVVDLDIDLMNQVASKLVGSHDFRNFCRKDISKPDQPFIRRIYEARIEPVNSQSSFFRFVCKGNAFLYHQVRCFMSILFMIGSKREPLELIDELFSKIDPSVAGPVAHYELASELPLVLYECFYEKPDESTVKWRNETQDNESQYTMTHLHHMWELKQAETFIYNGIRDTSGLGQSAIKQGGLYQKLLDLELSK